jgi:hypothetical protein
VTRPTNPNAPVVTVTISAHDAAQAGLQMRVLAHTHRMPDEVADLLDRVGQQLFSAGRLAANGGGQ